MVIPGIQSITVETRLLPRLRYDFTDPDPSPAVKALKPKITAQVADRNVLLYEPYGSPGGSLFPWLLGGFSTVLFFMGFALGKK